jgi:predicted glycosyltransferase
VSVAAPIPLPVTSPITTVKPSPLGKRSKKSPPTFRRPNVLVPRNGPVQEQRIRTDRLRQWNIARVVHAPDATPVYLASQIDAALHGDEPPGAPVSMDGLDRVVDAFDAALATSHAAA